MKILLTGSTGYIGRRLLPVLVDKGHEVVCLVRDKRKLDLEDFDADFLKKVKVYEGDLSDVDSLKAVPKNIDAAYYLVHSMTSGNKSFSDLEKAMAEKFVTCIDNTEAKQIIYLGGIINEEEEELSEHLYSRKKTEDILRNSKASLTVLRAAIIIGSGSASFEIIRDLTEKLPLMIGPRWVRSKCNPIAIRNVIEYLNGVLMNEKAFDRTFDIGSTDTLTYKDMLLTYAKVRNLKRYIIPVPLLTTRLSSLWLYFFTSTSYTLARNLVDSMVHDVVAKDKSILKVVPLKLYSYEESLEMAFSRINQKNIVSSWTDAVHNRRLDQNFLDNIEVPSYGCMKDIQEALIKDNKEEVIDNLWHIGGNRGWYYGNIMWQVRGVIDKIFGGVGLRRGRRSPDELKTGDSLDFWRVLLADRNQGRLLLYAEMKLPGEAWLEFKIREREGRSYLVQTATFRPLGIWGRMYWYLFYPFHHLIFPKMVKNIVNYKG
ncbi:MAG: SDR family oxidoreductase [Candidatus Cyclobacteriaceae bacterium M2_1C_046]